MTITFLVGNGFDIRMGIKSSYKEVEAHYVSLSKTDNRLKAFQQSIKMNGKYWANFEKRIGEYSGSFHDDEQFAFQLCLDDFTEELIKYLLTEESKIEYDLLSEEIRKEFVRSLSEYDATIPARYKNSIRSILHRNAGIVFRFVSFNYTHVLDECLRRAFEQDATVGKHVFNGTTYFHSANQKVLHIHGELPGPIIMGVDNQDQIANEAWANQRRFRQKLEKPAMNARAGSLVDEDVAKLINESNVICIYGMSLGETDKTWWKQLGNWLHGADRRLIIYGHSENYSQEGFTHQRQFDIQDEKIDQFFELAEIPSAERDSLESRIIVKINPNIFNINLVQLSALKKKENQIEKDARKKELEAAFQKHQKLAELTTAG